MDEHQKHFIKFVQQLSYSKSRALEDFAEMSALSFANLLGNAMPAKDAAFKKREHRWQSIAKQYSKEEMTVFPQMLASVVNSLSQDSEPGINFHDTLGEICMDDTVIAKFGSDVVLTPFHIGRLMASMTFGGLKMPEKGYITLAEPACGTGGLVIAACAEFHALGFNFQRQLHITATDIRAVLAHLCYIQLSLLHVPAVVIHGDSLSGKQWSIWETPAHTLGLWSLRLRRDFVLPVEPEKAIMLPKQISFDFRKETACKRPSNSRSRSQKSGARGVCATSSASRNRKR